MLKYYCQESYKTFIFLTIKKDMHIRTYISISNNDSLTTYIYVPLKVVQ